MKKFLPIVLILLLAVSSSVAKMEGIVASGIGENIVSAGGPDEWLGYNDTSGVSTTALAGGTVRCAAHATPSSAGTVTKVRIYSSNDTATQDFKFGLYTSSGGFPDGKIAAEQEITDVGTWSVGWHEITGLNFSVSTQEYWLCWDNSNDTATTYYYKSTTGTNRSWDENTSYATGWPATHVSSASSAANYVLEWYVD